MKPTDWVQLMSAIRKESEQPVNKELNEVVVGIVKQAMDQPSELEGFSNSLKQLKEVVGSGGFFTQDYKALEMQLKQNEDLWRRDVGFEILKRKWDLEDKKLQYESKKGDRIEKGLRTVLESVVGAVVEEDEGQPVGDLRSTRQDVIEYTCGDCNRKFKVAPDVTKAICPGCGRKWDLRGESEPAEPESKMTIRRSTTATGKSPLPEESDKPNPNAGNANEDASFSTSRSESGKKSQAQDAYNSLLDGAEQAQQ